MTRHRVFRALVWAVVGLAGIGFAIRFSSGVGHSTPTDLVEVAKLQPAYDGHPSTWAAVKRERAAGRARFTWVYSTNGGDYAVVFDTRRELRRWQCSAQVSELHLCSTQPTGGSAR
jgi:hypothetical protein